MCCVIMWFEPANNQRQQFNVVQRKDHLFSSTVVKLGGGSVFTPSDITHFDLKRKVK